jgi:hypothetical protein
MNHIEGFVIIARHRSDQLVRRNFEPGLVGAEVRFRSELLPGRINESVHRVGVQVGTWRGPNRIPTDALTIRSNTAGISLRGGATSDIATAIGRS